MLILHVVVLLYNDRESIDLKTFFVTPLSFTKHPSCHNEEFIRSLELVLAINKLN
jgi:hypothetical protein